MSDWARRPPRITGCCNGASLWYLKHCATDNSKDGSNVLWPPNNSVSLETEIVNLSVHPHNSAGVLKPAQDWYPLVFNDTEKQLLIFFVDLQNL